MLSFFASWRFGVLSLIWAVVWIVVTDEQHEQHEDRLRAGWCRP